MKRLSKMVSGPLALALVAIAVVGSLVGAYVLISNVVQFSSVSVQSSQTGININQMGSSEWSYYGAAPLSQLPAGNAETLSIYGVGVVLESEGYFSNMGLKMDLTYTGPAAIPANAITLQYKVGETGTWTALPMVWTDNTGTYDIPIDDAVQPLDKTFCLVKIVYNAPGTWGYSFTAYADAQ